jgi:hypothetical protein
VSEPHRDRRGDRVVQDRSGVDGERHGRTHLIRRELAESATDAEHCDDEDDDLLVVECETGSMQPEPA